MKKRFKAPVLLLLCVLLLTAAAGGLCAETPWGRVRIVGYKDSFPSDGRKFAPRAVLQDVAYSKDLDLYLEYSYERNGSDCRVWKVSVVNAHGENASYPGNLSIVFPYPSIWSAKDQAYWKWTQQYAERYCWYYSRGGYQSKYIVVNGVSIKIWTYVGEPLRKVQPVDSFGITVPMGRGLKKKTVKILIGEAGMEGQN